MGVIQRAELLLRALTYSGSGNWLDESGNGHDAVPNGGITFLLRNGPQYLWLPGTSGNYASAAAPQNVGPDFELVIRIAISDMTPLAHQGLISTYNDGTSWAWFCHYASTGELRLGISEDGTNEAKNFAATAVVGEPDGTILWLKIEFRSNDGGVATARFYKAADQPSEPTTWTEIGTKVSHTTTLTPYATPSTLTVGSNGAATNPTNGKVYRAIVRDGIGGTLVFDADFTDVGALTTPFSSFTENTGKTVTINRSSSGYASTVVDRDQWVLDGSDDYLSVANHANLNFGAAEDFTLMAVVRFASLAGNMALIAKRSGPSPYYYLQKRATTDDIFGRLDDGTNAVDRSGPTATARELAVAVAVRDGGSTFKVGLDNSFSTPATDPTGNLSNLDGLGIGAFSSGAERFLRGSIIAVAVWREALSDAEIKAAGDYLSDNLPNQLPLVGVG